MAKIEHHHWLLLIQINLVTKFQFKLKILIFWTKFAQREYFQSKTKKSEFCIAHPSVVHIRISQGTNF